MSDRRAAAAAAVDVVCCPRFDPANELANRMLAAFKTEW
jgi:hypothetical protein